MFEMRRVKHYLCTAYGVKFEMHGQFAQTGELTLNEERHTRCDGVYMRGRVGPAQGTTPRTRQHRTGRQRQGRPRFTSIRIVRPLQLLPPSQNKCPSMTL